MLALARPFAKFFAFLPKTAPVGPPIAAAPFHSLTCGAAPNPSLTQRVGGLFDLTIRTVIRVHFPRPNEVKRVRRHGWKKRMSTAAGRKILMNRILKGRYVYSH